MAPEEKKTTRELIAIAAPEDADVFVEEMTRVMVDIANEIRAQHGLPPLPEE